MSVSWLVYFETHSYGRQWKENSKKVEKPYKNTPQKGAFLMNYE